MDATSILLVIIGLLAFLFLVRLLMNIQELRSQLRHVNVEIERASPEDLPRWKRRRRKLWLRFFLHPFRI